MRIESFASAMSASRSLIAAVVLGMCLNNTGCNRNEAEPWPSVESGLDVSRSQISFATNGVEIEWGAETEAFKNKVLARGNADERLVIIGMTLPGEQAIYQGLALGYLRAQAAKSLFTSLPAERLEIESQVSTDTSPDAPMIRLEWRAVIAPIFANVPAPLSFAYGSAVPITSEQIEALKQALDTGAPGQRLEITVRYFDGESEALAHARGEAVQQLLQPTIASNRTLIVLRAEAHWPFGSGAGELTAFRWVNP